MPRHCIERGFTFVEVIVVTALMALVAAFLITGFLNYASYQRFLVAQTEVISLTKESRQRSLSAVDDTTHGIYFASTSITTFAGNSYSVGDPSNTVTPVYGAEISTDLTGGTDEIVFARKTGVASAVGTVYVVALDSSATSTITIAGTGLVELQ